MNNTTVMIDLTADSDYGSYYYENSLPYPFNFNYRNVYNHIIFSKPIEEIKKENRNNYKILKRANMRLKKNKYFNNYH